MVKHREMLDRNANRSHRFAAAAGLLSRLAIRKNDESLRNQLLDLATWPAQLQVSERWWLVDDLVVLTRGVCESLSASAFYTVLPNLLASPVPGSNAFQAPPPHMRWVDPVSVLDRRHSPPKDWDGILDEVDRIMRVVRIGSTAANLVERRYLILRLVKLAGRGLLNEEQLRGFSNALFAFRRTSVSVLSRCRWASELRPNRRSRTSQLQNAFAATR